MAVKNPLGKHMHKHTHTYTHTYTLAYIRTHRYTHTYTHTRIHIGTQTHTHTHTNTHIFENKAWQSRTLWVEIVNTHHLLKYIILQNLTVNFRGGDIHDSLFTKKELI